MEKTCLLVYHNGYVMLRYRRDICCKEPLLMPRDLPLGNGQFLVNFDKIYNVRDIYCPHVGQELHTRDISHTGVWVNGRFAWLDAPEWQREMGYEQETLITCVTLTHPTLQLSLVFHDLVDFHRPLFLRYLTVTNLANEAREVRLFFHYDWHIWGDVDGNTVFYHPPTRSLVAYKGSAYFLANGQVGSSPQAQSGISSWATGIKEVRGSEGTWRDAEDGKLGCNPIAQGSVDGTMALHLPSLAAQASAEAYHWLAAGPSLTSVIEVNELVLTRG